MVWLYNGSGRQLPAAVLFHTMINVTYVLFPVGGSHYDPAVTGIIVAAFVAAMLVYWGWKRRNGHKWRQGEI